MRVLLFLIFCTVNQVVPAQISTPDSSATCIHFQKFQSWTQLREMAKAENKYIFMDCFTTWCGPCRQMENTVYKDKNVAKFINKFFISVKVQLDTTVKDDEYIQSLYPVATMLQSKYNVFGYPTFLYFSNEGEIKHRGMGLQSSQEFLAICKDALDSNRQFYALLHKYENGSLDQYLIGRLSTNTATLLNNKELSSKMASQYIVYLNTLNDSELLDKRRLEFMQNWTELLTSKSKYFKLFNSKAYEIDSIMENQNLSQALRDYIITKEEVLKSQVRTPEWTKDSVNIARKYGKQDALRIILNAKLNWYFSHKYWQQAIICYANKIDRYGLDTTFSGCILANNIIYELIFKHCTDRHTIHKFLPIMFQVMSIEHFNPDDIDTYANLLYKGGNQHEAIHWEEKAAAAEPVSEILQHLDKMKRNIPTWE